MFELTQLSLTCSKSTIETQEKGVKHVSQFSSVSIVDFEQLNVNQVFDSLRTDVRKQYLKNIFYKGGYENFQKIYKKAFAKKSIF